MKHLEERVDYEKNEYGKCLSKVQVQLREESREKEMLKKSLKEKEKQLDKIDKELVSSITLQTQLEQNLQEKDA